MTSASGEAVRDIRYEPEEQPPPALALGLGFQFAMLTVAGIVLTPAIVVRAAGGSEDFLSWATFAALAISGVTTVLQAVRVGRVGAGHVLLMGTSAAFIAVCVTALLEGGPGCWRRWSPSRRCSSSGSPRSCRCCAGYSRRRSAAR